ncbi:MAG: hypothetical protein SV775_16105, partial [Thermodesulfobacteriota bacterium]|nr:hypothetical protein [Thermodesulfobacteriota bacterium]
MPEPFFIGGTASVPACFKDLQAFSMLSTIPQVKRVVLKGVISPDCLEFLISADAASGVLSRIDADTYVVDLAAAATRSFSAFPPASPSAA